MIYVVTLMLPTHWILPNRVLMSSETPDRQNWYKDVVIFGFGVIVMYNTISNGGDRHDPKTETKIDEQGG